MVPWVMAAMTAAQMLQNQDNADRKRKVDAAGIRYSPWSGISKLPFEADRTVDTAIQGYTGVTGQMQADEDRTFDKKLKEAQLAAWEARAAAMRPKPGGSMMNLYQPNQATQDPWAMQQNPWRF